MPVPARTSSDQRAMWARMERNRRHLLARLLADSLTQATAALVEALGDDQLGAGVWRVAANHTSTLLGVLARGAARLGRPLPPETQAVADVLRTWAVTACSDRRTGLVVVLAGSPGWVVARGCPGPADRHPPASRSGHRPGARPSDALAPGSPTLSEP